MTPNVLRFNMITVITQIHLRPAAYYKQCSLFSSPASEEVPPADPGALTARFFLFLSGLEQHLAKDAAAIDVCTCLVLQQGGSTQGKSIAWRCLNQKKKITHMCTLRVYSTYILYVQWMVLLHDVGPWIYWCACGRFLYRCTRHQWPGPQVGARA